MWTWTAICADTKLVPSWLVGERTDRGRPARSCTTSRAGMRRPNPAEHGRPPGIPWERPIAPSRPDEVDWAQIHKLYKSQAVALGPVQPASLHRKTKVTVPPRATRTRPGSARATWSARTSLCGWGCVGSRGSRTASQSRSRTWRTPSACTTCITTSAAPRQSLQMTPAMAAGVADHKWGLGEIAALLD